VGRVGLGQKIWTHVQLYSAHATVFDVDGSDTADDEGDHDEGIRAANSYARNVVLLF